VCDAIVFDARALAAIGEEEVESVMFLLSVRCAVTERGRNLTNCIRHSGIRG